MESMAHGFMKYLSPRWLVGPILDKEMRVSSRRLRNYVVRAAYLALLTLFVTLAWLDAAPHNPSGALRTVEMARAGQGITILIVWFQFLACQVVAIVMLSTAISDEIFHRTLGVLMTTPINSFQIVIGKLAGRLLQVVLLMGLSLPLLAIVRVFGGIAWVFLVGAWVLTLTTTLFVGSVSLLFSIFCRRAYVVITWTVLGLGALWGVIPLLAALVGTHYKIINERQLEVFLSWTHPYFGLVQLSAWFMSPWAVPLPFGVHGAWLWPSLVMVIGTIGVLTLAVFRVRVVARRQITGDMPASGGPSKMRGGKRTSAWLIPVHGCPVLWKEMRAPLLGRRRWLIVLGTALALGMLSVIYVVAADERAFGEQAFHVSMVFFLMMVGALFCIVTPATTITSEKESRSWPILLGTTLSDWRIVLAKGLGSMRRGLPAWVFLAGHVVVFTVVGFIHPMAILQLAMVVTGLVAFLTGTGLYFSSRFKHTTTAVIANLAVPTVLWGLVPIVMAMILTMSDTRPDPIIAYMGLCPFAQAMVITDTCARGWKLQMYHLGDYNLDTGEAMVFLLMTMALFILLGLVFAGRAKTNLRRRIF